MIVNRPYISKVEDKAMWYWAMKLQGMLLLPLFVIKYALSALECQKLVKECSGREERL